jgi:hypothetical protein
MTCVEDKAIGNQHRATRPFQRYSSFPLNGVYFVLTAMWFSYNVAARATHRPTPCPTFLPGRRIETGLFFRDTVSGSLLRSYSGLVYLDSVLGRAQVH